MSLTSYYNTIKFFFRNLYWSFSPSPSAEKQIAALESMESDRLYIENVRSFFNVSNDYAKHLCEQGVEENIFVKKIGLLCPEDRQIILVIENENQNVPEEIKCDSCEESERPRFTFKTKDLDRLPYYTFAKQ